MQLPQSLTTVTRFSKIIAMFLFILLPFLGFYLGTKYQQSVSSQTQQYRPLQTIKPTLISNTSENWQTYTNAEYGFSFKHPYLDSSVGLIGATHSAKLAQCFTDKQSIREGTDAPFDGFCIYVDPNINNAPFEKYVNNQKQLSLTSYNNDDPRVTITPSEIEVNIGGKNSILLTGHNVFKTAEVFIPLDSQKILILEKSHSSRDFDKIFQQILSTFRFTDGDQNNIVCTQEVKQCPDGSYVGRQPPECEFRACP